MLLWSVLHLTSTRAVNADYESLGESSVAFGASAPLKVLQRRFGFGLARVVAAATELLGRR